MQTGNRMEAAWAGEACEFFAGMGLVRRALEAEGSEPRFRVVFASDFDPVKARLYRALRASEGDGVSGSEVFDPRDIHDVAPSDIPAADLWTASFPCTDLSLAGRGAGIHAGQSRAVWRLLELLRATRPADRPAHVLFENVPALLTSHGGRDFQALVSALNRAGYGVDPLLVDAAWFTPQSRQRVLLIATRADHPACPPRADARALMPTDARPSRVLRTMRAAAHLDWRVRRPPPAPEQRQWGALADIIEPADSPDLRWWDEARTARFLAQLHPGHVDRLEDLRAAQGVATAFRRVRVVAGEKRPVWEIRADGLAGCLRTPKGGSAVQALVDARTGAARVRALAPIEAARLQGIDALPEGFSDTELLFALGDAVCAPAIRWALDLLETQAAALT